MCFWTWSGLVLRLSWRLQFTSVLSVFSQEAIAEGLVDRLADCKRSFPTAAVINGAGDWSRTTLACSSVVAQPCCYRHGVLTRKHSITPAIDKADWHPFLRGRRRKCGQAAGWRPIWGRRSAAFGHI